jgi:Bacterial regulatory helix-turn-helix protein, lysR family
MVVVQDPKRHRDGLDPVVSTPASPDLALSPPGQTEGGSGSIGTRQYKSDARAIDTPGSSTVRAPGRTDVLGRVGALDLDLLRAIVLTAEAGSISGAAGVLGYSQPGLSQRLQVAERALGCRLFHRGPQGVKVTSLGVVVLPYAKVLLSVAQTMVQAITHAQQGDR